VRYLEFYRVEAARTNPAPSGTRALALYDLTPGPGILPPLPVPWPKPPTPLPMPPLDLLRSARWELRWRVRETRRVLLRNGYIKDAATLVAKGDPANCFDIVILGDGFLDSELGVFDYQANLLAQGLLATWPFSDFVDKINVHVVRAVSLQSGITDVPLGTIRKTYFETRGYWNGKPSPSFIGTAATSVVLDAIDTIIPHEHANLIIIVTNNLLNGGSAPPELGMAFVTLNSTDAGFLNVAAHESGHVIAKLAEEYVSCTERDSTRTYPNEVTQAEVNAKNVWWTTLATAAEKDSSGFLATIHTYGDPLDTSPGADTCQPPPGLRNILGLFWGGQNSNPPHPTACSNYCDADGAAFYRPMAECKMRRRKYGFCRVCGYLISTVIASTTS
jgi:hypothetical protein